ncbi:MAG TPA: PadR family transcriptional regulator [Actinomycetota bacterium]
MRQGHDEDEVGHGGHHHRHPRPHHHEAFGPFGGHGRWGANWFGGPPWAGGRRARRGDVRAALLTLLAERPMHGYDLIRELEERSGGMWRPSPGSVYPTLQMLEDEEFVTSDEQDGKRIYSITDAGRVELEERKNRQGAAPWECGEAVAEGLAKLRDSMFQLGAAAMQVARTGSAEQRGKAAEILSEARKKLYAILAEG